MPKVVDFPLIYHYNILYIVNIDAYIGYIWYLIREDIGYVRKDKRRSDYWW